MKKILPAISLLVVLLSLAGCWNGRVLFFLEQPAWTAMGGGPKLRARLVVDSLGGGRFPSFSIVAPPTEPLSRLTTELGARHYAAAVIGPLLAAEWQGFAVRFPSTRFVLVGGSAGRTDLPPNVTTLVFDRRDAFRSVAYAAALAVRAQFGGGNLGARIGVLAALQSDLTDAEIDAFGAGVEEVLDGDRPVVRRFAASADRTAATTAVKQLRLDGVEILLLGMGSLDPACLEALGDAGGSAVVADWAAWRPYPAQVFLSVEKDYVAGLRTALSSATAEVAGPVRIEIGEARGIPREARGRLGMK